MLAICNLPTTIYYKRNRVIKDKNKIKKTILILSKYENP